MAFVESKLVELALINLAYAQAEIIGANESSEYIERALCHIGEADAFLRFIAPEFDSYSSDARAEVI